MALSSNELVARNVRRFRSERRLSLGELARRSGVSKQTLSKIEGGVGNPTVDTLAALASALDVSLRSLLTEWGSPVFVQRASAASWEHEGGWMTRAMDQIYGSGYVRTTVVGLDESMPRRTEVEPHSAGTLHHAYVLSGRVRLGPVNAAVDLGPGDFVRYPGDGVHIIERLGKQAMLHIVTTVPQVPQFGPEGQPELPLPA
jgi:transcriptional regulator with XRE-family HTH domain